MIGKIIEGYMKLLQEHFNPYNIHFDTIFTPNMDDLKSYMASFNLRQTLGNYDAIKALYLDEDMLEKFKNENPNGLIYNAIQYKFSPIKPDIEGRMQNTPFTFSYTVGKKPDGGLILGDFVSDKKEIKEGLRKAFEAEHLERKIAQREIHEFISGKIDYSKYEAEGVTFESHEREGYIGSIDLECRLLTPSNDIMETFQIVYLNRIMKNPSIEVPLLVEGQEILTMEAVTKHQEVSSIDHLDYQTKGNLRAITFNTTISAVFLTPYSKKFKPIRSVEIGLEVRDRQR